VKVSPLARLFTCGRTCEVRISGTLAALRNTAALTCAAAVPCRRGCGGCSGILFADFVCSAALPLPSPPPRRCAERAKFSRRGISASRAMWGSPWLDRVDTTRRYCSDAPAWYSYSSAFACSNFRYCILCGYMRLSVLLWTIICIWMRKIRSCAWTDACGTNRAACKIKGLTCLLENAFSSLLRFVTQVVACCGSQARC